MLAETARLVLTLTLRFRHNVLLLSKKLIKQWSAVSTLEMNTQVRCSANRFICLVQLKKNELDNVTRLDRSLGGFSLIDAVLNYYEVIYN